MPRFGRRSTKNILEAHPDLQRLFYEVIKYFDCTVIDAYRPQEEQDEAYYTGRSKLKFPQSKHNIKPSMAIDVVPWFTDEPHVRWRDMDTFYYFAGFVKGIAANMGIDITTGLDWDSDNDLKDQTFQDAAHFELRL